VYTEEETDERMSLHSSNRLQKSINSETASLVATDLVLEDKVIQLEETLKKFRAEVDMKMSIMEQVLTTRNGNFKLS